jgi:L-lactate dehydrogenase complex protein LldG
MSARDEILDRLRQQEREAKLPARWQSRRHFDDLAIRFADSLTAGSGEVFRASSLPGALAQLGRLLTDLGVKTAVTNDELPLSGLDLPARWPAIDWHMVGQTGGELRAFCAAADIGLSGAEAALAETGTIILASGPGRSRLASLLPPIHLALVPVSCLTTDIFTWAAGRQGSPPANVTLISGPSKTADIEQTLAIGVHGPKRFIVILYDD